MILSIVQRDPSVGTCPRVAVPGCVSRVGHFLLVRKGKRNCWRGLSFCYDSRGPSWKAAGSSMSHGDLNNLFISECLLVIIVIVRGRMKSGENNRSRGISFRGAREGLIDFGCFLRCGA